MADDGPMFVRDGNKEICRLTVRDCFAMTALWGLLSNPNVVMDEEETATSALIFADAMLAKRDKPTDPDSPLWGEQHKET